MSARRCAFFVHAKGLDQLSVLFTVLGCLIDLGNEVFRNTILFADYLRGRPIKPGAVVFHIVQFGEQLLKLFGV